MEVIGVHSKHRRSRAYLIRTPSPPTSTGDDMNFEADTSSPRQEPKHWRCSSTDAVRYAADGQRHGVHRLTTATRIYAA